jgi:hypothetical protein
MFVYQGHLFTGLDNEKFLRINVCPPFFGDDYHLSGPFHSRHLPGKGGKSTRAAVIFHEMSHHFLLTNDDYMGQGNIGTINQIYSIPQSSRAQVAASWEMYFDGVYLMRTLMRTGPSPAQLSDVMARDLTKIYYERDNVECQKYDICKNIPGLNRTTTFDWVPRPNI